jgi:hypothetical protein
MADVIDVDEAEATDISTPVLEAPGLRRRRRATAPAAWSSFVAAERANDAREERDAAAVELNAHADAFEERGSDAEVGHPEHDELGMPGGGFPFFGPGPPPVDIPADEGLDWQVEKVAKRTGTAFAVGLFAGVHLAPGGLQHTRPTFEVLDTAKRVKDDYSGLRSLGVATSAGVLLGAAFDRLWGLVGWLLVHFLTPRRFLQAFAIAWCYSLRAFGTTRRFALWNAVSSLCICRDAPLGLRVAAVLYEARYLVAPYLFGDTDLATAWATESYWGLGISLIIIMASAADIWRESLVRWATGGRDPMMMVMNNISPTFPMLCVMTFATVSTALVPANPPLVCLLCTLGPSWLASRINPWLGLVVYLVLRATELVGTCPWLLTRSRPLELYWGDNPGLLWWIYGPRVRGAWANRTDHLGLRFESPAKRRERLAFWKRYKRAVRLEHGKSLKRQHRAVVEAMIHDEGLLEELPDDVTGCILEYLYKPTAADRRDERAYKQFRRRPRNSMTMDPFEAFENHGSPALGLIGAMMLPMFMNPGRLGM